MEVGWGEKNGYGDVRPGRFQGSLGRAAFHLGQQAWPEAGTAWAVSQARCQRGDCSRCVPEQYFPASVGRKGFWRMMMIVMKMQAAQRTMVDDVGRDGWGCEVGVVDVPRDDGRRAGGEPIREHGRNIARSLVVVGGDIILARRAGERGGGAAAHSVSAVCLAVMAIVPPKRALRNRAPLPSRFPRWDDVTLRVHLWGSVHCSCIGGAPDGLASESSENIGKTWGGGGVAGLDIRGCRGWQAPRPLWRRVWWDGRRGSGRLGGKETRIRLVRWAPVTVVVVGFRIGGLYENRLAVSHA